MNRLYFIPAEARKTRPRALGRTSALALARAFARALALAFEPLSLRRRPAKGGPSSRRRIKARRAINLNKDARLARRRAGAQQLAARKRRRRSAGRPARHEPAGVGLAPAGRQHGAHPSRSGRIPRTTGSSALPGSLCGRSHQVAPANWRPSGRMVCRRRRGRRGRRARRFVCETSALNGGLRRRQVCS